MNVEIEHKIFVVEINENMQAEMNKETAQGWTIIPEIKPVAIYHMVRAKPQQQANTIGVGAKLEVDDRKVGILRGGFVYWPDGTRSKQGEPWEARTAYSDDKAVMQ